MGEQKLGSDKIKNVKETAGEFESSIEGALTGLTYSTSTLAACKTGGLESEKGKNGELVQGSMAIKGMIIE
jgi:hypothetical protein